MKTGEKDKARERGSTERGKCKEGGAQRERGANISRDGTFFYPAREREK